MPLIGLRAPGARRRSFDINFWEYLYLLAAIQGPFAVDEPRKSDPPTFLEPTRQPSPIRTILIPPRHLDHLTDNTLQPEFEERPIVNFEQPVGDMDAEIPIDPDQMSVEGGVMELR